MKKRAFKNRRRGFSLIAVLILGLAGLSIAGVTFQLMTSGAGSGRVVSASNRRYNLLTSAVEEIRAKMIKRMDGTDPPPKRMTAGNITEMDHLLIESPTEIAVLSGEDLAFYGLSGGSGKVSVRIYDMQYKPEHMQIDLSDPKKRKLLPPSIILYDPPEPGLPLVDADNAGAYLIRATLTVDGDEENPAGSVAMALILSNNS